MSSEKAWKPRWLWRKALGAEWGGGQREEGEGKAWKGFGPAGINHFR